MIEAQLFSATQSCYSQEALNLTERSLILDQPHRVFKKNF